jgi:hypothetical protein
MNPDDRPVNDRAPLPDLPGVGPNGNGARLRRRRGPPSRFAVEPGLRGSVVDNFVLGMMAFGSVDVMRKDGPWDTKRQRLHQQDNERNTHHRAASPSTSDPDDRSEKLATAEAPLPQNNPPFPLQQP